MNYFEKKNKQLSSDTPAVLKRPINDRFLHATLSTGSFVIDQSGEVISYSYQMTFEDNLTEEVLNYLRQKAENFIYTQNKDEKISVNKESLALNININLSTISNKETKDHEFIKSVFNHIRNKDKLVERLKAMTKNRESGKSKIDTRLEMQ